MGTESVRLLLLLFHTPDCDDGLIEYLVGFLGLCRVTYRAHAWQHQAHVFLAAQLGHQMQ
jgi:hypothetical protein